MAASKGKEVWLCRDGDGAYCVAFDEARPTWNDDMKMWIPDNEYEPVDGDAVLALLGCHPIKAGECFKVRLSMEVVDE